MNKTTSILVGISLLYGFAVAQDTMYVHQHGGTITKIAVNKIDSVVFYNTLITAPPIGTVIFPAFGTITDQDGNIVKTVQIGTQTWFAENLKVIKYNDWTSIPYVFDDKVWFALNTGAQCNFYNLPTGGKFYNWYAVNSRKLCPMGWHIPSDAEWSTLQSYLIANGYNYNGNTTDNLIAKAMASNNLWMSSPNIGAPGYNPSTNNTSGFSSLSEGLRLDGPLNSLGSNAYWWSSSEYNISSAYFYVLCYSYSSLNKSDFTKVNGLSVRCLKD